MSQEQLQEVTSLETLSDEELQEMYLAAELEAEEAANYVLELATELMRRLGEDAEAGDAQA